MPDLDYKSFHPSYDDKCPYCGNENLDYDVLHDNEGNAWDIVDCPKCKRRLYSEEDY